MRLLIATDAWHPQVNGVVSTYARLETELVAKGCAVAFLSPSDFRTMSCPGYRQIQLAIPDQARARRLIESHAADHIHIATEGPIGWMARAYCTAARQSFTTSYHTRFPEYLHALLAVPPSLTYRVVRRFHAPSSGVMAATPSLRRELSLLGFKNIMAWTRGVDTQLFHPRPDRLFGDEGPVFLYVGRVSREKNIEAFLDAPLPGRKVVVGDGPHLAALRRTYGNVIFTGQKTGEDLARHYASADVFVFPSLTDTFGLVILEAMASGLPIAAFPVTGPIDIIEDGISGCLDEDLTSAALRALTLDGQAARARAAQFSWNAAAQAFLDNIETARAASVDVGAEANNTKNINPQALRQTARAHKPEISVHGKC